MCSSASSVNAECAALARVTRQAVAPATMVSTFTSLRALAPLRGGVRSAPRGVARTRIGTSDTAGAASTSGVRMTAAGACGGGVAEAVGDTAASCKPAPTSSRAAARGCDGDGGTGAIGETTTATNGVRRKAGRGGVGTGSGAGAGAGGRCADDRRGENDRGRCRRGVPERGSRRGVGEGGQDV